MKKFFEKLWIGVKAVVVLPVIFIATIAIGSIPAIMTDGFLASISKMSVGLITIFGIAVLVLVGGVFVSATGYVVGKRIERRLS